MSDTPKTPFKFRIYKAIDISGLTFLTPVARLCYGEEPREQLRQIFRYVMVPLMAFVVFLLLWGYFAPRHKTKYGAVPTPVEVWYAWDSVLAFHDRETAKEHAYVATGAAREKIMAYALERQKVLKPLLEQGQKGVEEARAAEKALKAERAAPLEMELEHLQTAMAEQKKTRLTELKAQADQLGDRKEAHAAYKSAYAAYDRWLDEQSQLQRDLKDRIKLIQDEKNPAVVAALRLQTRYAEEDQYVSKLIELAGESGREVKTAELQQKLDELTAAYVSVAGADAANAAKRILLYEDRIAKTQTSTYAKPWTLPMQIQRSVLCVFCGFFVGVMIAVPIGVLCGLSPTFMAAMTPFIALFKPVSPIVWLLILWIIVGGFFPDPDNHWLIQFLWDLPLIGWMKINPAFIASALTVAMCSLWATMVNTALGVASVDKDHLNVARVLRLGFWDRLFKIVLPSALPLMFAGMRISLGVGWMVLIAAELLASSEGLGKFTWDMFNNGASDSFAKIMAMVFVVGVIGLLLDRIMIVFQRLVSFEGAPAAI